MDAKVVNLSLRTFRFAGSNLLVCGVLSSSLIACGGDTTGPAPLTAAQAYWMLRLNYHAVNLSLTPPYNTVQLTATPLNAKGTPLSGPGTVTYTAADSTVSVDSTGLVTANYKTSSVDNATRVVATLRHQNVTLADTVAIQVTSTSPATALATFTLKHPPGTSTTCNLNALISQTQIENCGPLFVDATDTGGDTLSNANGSSILIAYRTSDPLVAQIDPHGIITESDTGSVTMTASTWAYGVVKSDSLRYVIGWPRVNYVKIYQVTPVNSLTPILIFDPAVVIQVGGVVAWRNLNSQLIDVVFDDSTDVASGCTPELKIYCGFPPPQSGNIPPFSSDLFFGFAVRSFPVAGTYHYHSRLFPASSGVIDVREDLQ